MRIRGSIVRRALLGAGLVLLVTVAWWSSSILTADASGETRTISMYNIHTKENITITYKRDGKFDKDALKQLDHFMRDWRVEKERDMDPDLIDLIWTLHETLGSKEPVHLICGYRTAATNAKLRRAGGGQAKRSQHILGKAADITFPDIPVKKLRESALIEEVGGVGYYPTSGVPFVHVDTGRVRMWPRMPRLELAALFPSGHTGYLPRDGRPITPADYKLALAKGLVDQILIAANTPLPTPNPELHTAPAVPKPILASYSPAQPTSSKPTIKPAGQRFADASAGGGFGFSKPRLPRDDQPAVPTYESAEVVGAPEVDDDHPDELSYAPLDTASLMTDRSISYSHTVAPLVHPDQQNLDYMFEDMDRPTAFELRASSGYRGLASVQQFSGPAVHNLYAEMEAPAPTRVADATR
jgi:uncharacterized protein YcbK (DUF882 family)